jgi:hypothetical protein
MQTLIILLIAGLTLVALGPSNAQAKPDPGRESIVVAAKPGVKSDVAPESLTGEVISVEKGARRMTVRYDGWFTTEEITFAVAEPAVPMLDGIREGDRVAVGYSEARDQLIAKIITKLPPERDTRK